MMARIKRYEIAGHVFLFLNGKLHCEDGPAIQWSDGCKEWWINGKRHREDGPALIYCFDCMEWWLFGKKITKKEFDQWRYRDRQSECV